MSEVLRTILIVILAGVAVTTVAIFASWWFEPSRRLRRALRRVLGGPAFGQVQRLAFRDPAQHPAQGPA